MEWSTCENMSSVCSTNGTRNVSTPQDRASWLRAAGLAGEHHRVGAVEDGVGDVAGLGAGGAGVLDHRVEHLGGDDDGFGVLPAELDGLLLDQRHLFERELDAEVAAGDHQAVEGE